MPQDIVDLRFQLLQQCISNLTSCASEKISSLGRRLLYTSSTSFYVRRIEKRTPAYGEMIAVAISNDDIESQQAAISRGSMRLVQSDRAYLRQSNAFIVLKQASHCQASQYPTHD